MAKKNIKEITYGKLTNNFISLITLFYQNYTTVDVMKKKKKNTENEFYNRINC